jgi:hypothetical protein
MGTESERWKKIKRDKIGKSYQFYKLLYIENNHNKKMDQI